MKTYNGHRRRKQLFTENNPQDGQRLALCRLILRHGLQTAEFTTIYQLSSACKDLSKISQTSSGGVWETQAEPPTRRLRFTGRQFAIDCQIAANQSVGSNPAHCFMYIAQLTLLKD